MTPTPLGEGKTTTTIGLAQALNRIGVGGANNSPAFARARFSASRAVRAGGGYSQVVPMEDINLHFTGDIHAVAAAHNLGAAFLDNHLFRGNALEDRPSTIRWPRVLDVNDRALRRVLLGLRRDTRRARDRSSTSRPRPRSWRSWRWRPTSGPARADRPGDRGRDTHKGKPVTLEDLQVAGAMAVLMRDAIKPQSRPDARGRAGLRARRPIRQHRPRQLVRIADRVALQAWSTPLSPRPASARTWASRSSPTSSAGIAGSSRAPP